MVFLYKTKHRSFHWFFILTLFVGYFLSFSALYHAGQNREKIGTLVGWDGHETFISGVAGGLISTSEFSHKYRVTVSEIDKKSVSPFDISLILAPNLSLTTGDRVVAFGKFSFPRDTVDYMAEKQLWNGGMVAEFRTFHVDKTPPVKYSIFVRLRNWFDMKLSDIFPER